jgi:hypothetical protein
VCNLLSEEVLLTRKAGVYGIVVSINIRDLAAFGGVFSVEVADGLLFIAI